MFLSDLRGQQMSYGFRDAVDLSLDDPLIADCRALTTQISDLIDGMEKASVAQATEHEFLMALLRQTDEQLCRHRQLGRWPACEM